MPLLAFVLVLVAAVIHASWNLVVKRAGGDIRYALMTAIAVAVIWTPVGLYAAWHEVGAYGAMQWSLIAASGVVHVAYYITLLRGYRLGDLSVVYPLARGTGPLITAVVATILLGETLGLRGWVGVAAIVAGILLIAGGPALLVAIRRGVGDGEEAPGAAGVAHTERERLRAGLRYGLVTGGFIAAYSVIDGYAVKRAGVSPISVDYLGTAVRIPLMVALLLWLRRRESLPMAGYWRPLLPSALVVGLVSPVAYVLVLYAVQMAPLSHVAPMREVSMLFAALFGGTLLGERHMSMRLAGAACIATGVAALALV